MRKRIRDAWLVLTGQASATPLPTRYGPVVVTGFSHGGFIRLDNPSGSTPTNGVTVQS